MNKISLIGMEFYAYHGFYKEERILGGDYLVDVEIEADLGSSSSDELEETINYESIYAITKSIMEEPVKLIEKVAFKISEAIKSKYNEMHALHISIHKLNPPLGSSVKESKFELREVFHRRCPKCKKNNVCYNSESCWCKNYKIADSTLASLRANYEGCLCESCFSEFANKP